MSPAATIFIDTEFTDLSPIGGMNPPKLISLGASVLQDDQYFYSEISDSWQQSDCSEWVCKNVLPLLQAGDAQVVLTGAKLNFRRWIERLNRPASIIGSSEYDIHFVMNLLQGESLPSNLVSVSVAGWSNFSALGRYHFSKAEKQYFALRGGQHHALCDALAFKEAWRAGRAVMPQEPVGNIFWSRPAVQQGMIP